MNAPTTTATPTPIRDLIAQATALDEEGRAVDLECEAASDPATKKALTEKSERLDEQASDFRAEVFQTPAATFDELIRKARVAYRVNIGDAASCEPLDASEAPVAGTDDNPRAGRLEDDVLIWSILKDIESMAVPAAVAAPAVPASMAPVAEDPIVGLWRELLAHRASAEDDNKWLAVETEILQMDALTAEGWAIQARLLAEQVDGRPDRGDERVAKRIAQHFRRLADAERLGGASVSATTAIDETADAGDKLLLDLERLQLETRAQGDRLNVEDDEPEIERLYDLSSDLEEEIAKAPAHTVAGIAVKIRLLQKSHEQDRDAYDAVCLRTALEALERLAGGVS